jgi:predicted RND superfamily exporter protein
MIQQIRNDQKEGSVDVSLLQSYVQMIEYLQQSFSEVDKKSQKLLAMCQIALNQEDKKIKKTYLKNGKLITYAFDEKMMQKKLSQIDSEENRQPNEDEIQPKFFVPFMDIKKVIRVAF